MACARTRVLLLAVVTLAAAVWPAAAEETLFARGVLYELGEHINCNPGPEGPFPEMPADCSNVVTQGFGTRIADAYLRGHVWGPADSPFNGEIEAEAASILSKVDWTGPAHGKVRVGIRDGERRPARRSCRPRYGCDESNGAGDEHVEERQRDV